MDYMVLPQIDPVIFSIGPLTVRWYGLMYVLGFVASYLLVRAQICQHKYTLLEDNFDNLNTLLILCVVIGGRLGYVAFYNLSYYLQHPGQIFSIWHGGMSFHGACLTLVLGGFLFCKFKKLDFWKTADIYVATVPIGLGLGRIGNLINSELYGRETTVPWAVIFPQVDQLPRHPSQIYQSFLEGVVLFLLLWSCRNLPWQGHKRFPHGSILAMFLIGYGILRIIAENFRQPDAHLGFIFAQITMGQILSVGMILGGFLIWFWRMKIDQKK